MKRIRRGIVKFTLPFLLIFSFSAVCACGKQPDEAGKVKDSKFLLETRWYQYGEFAKFAPDGLRIGCWSTAIAQILYYHRLKPRGKVSYKTSLGYGIDVGLDSHAFNWDLFTNSIDSNTSQASIDEVAKYSYFASVVVGCNFGAGGYVGPISRMKSELEAHYNCEVNDYYYTNSSFLVRQKQIKDLVVNEIDHFRPLLLYLHSPGHLTHATVLDGYRIKNNEFWVHINMGWGGMDDGWYNLFKDIRFGDLRHRKILTIKPLKNGN